MIPPKLAAFGAKYGIYIGIALLAMVILILTYCQGRDAGRTAVEAEMAIASVEAMQTDAEAQANASAARADDAAKVNELREELANVVQDIPDTVPDPVAVASGCDILRRQGKDTATIPACGGR